MRRLALLVLVVAAVSGAMAGVDAGEETEAGRSCSRRQVMGDGSHWYHLTDQAMSTGAGRMVFHAGRDPSDYPYPTGDGAPRSYLYDAGSAELRRLRSPQFAYARSPKVSADGGWVVLSGKPRQDTEVVIYDTGFEAYLYEVRTGQTRLLTAHGDERDGSAWAISDDGGRVLVRAADPYVPLSRRTWVYDRATNTKLRIPNGSQDLSPDGSTVLVATRQDLAGQNPDGNIELFAFDIATFGAIQLTSTELPDVSGRYEDIAFTDGGRSVVFSTRTEDFGPNPEGLRRFTIDLATQALRPLSDRGAEGIVSRQGGHIALASTADPIGANADGTEERSLFDVAAGTTNPLTDDPPHRWYSPSEAVAPDGAAIAYTSITYDRGPNAVVLLRACDPAPAPDALVAQTGGAFVGDGVRWAVATPSQRVVATPPVRTSATFTVRVQNDRTVPDSFSVQGAESGAPGYVVAFRRGGADISAQVVAGTYRVGPLAAGASVDLEVRVTAATATPGTTHAVDVTVRSAANPIARDTVRAKVTAAPAAP